MNPKYILLPTFNELKQLSFEDNVYFTLRDIFFNINDATYCGRAIDYIMQLTNGICYEARDENFQYTNLLNNVEYVDSLYNNYIKYIKPHWFDNNTASHDINDFYAMNFNEWWEQFENMREQLKNRLEFLTIQK